MIHYRDSVVSTQDEMKVLLESRNPVPHLTAITAVTQTGGRGRQGRSWVSGEGNLFASIYLSGFMLPVTWVPHWVGLSLVESLQNLSLSAEDLQLKWPNDLYFKREFKVAGILCEKVDHGVIAGVGVNIQSHPDLADRKSTSLQAEFPTAVVAGFSKMLLSEIIRVMANEPDLLRLKQAYLEHALFHAGDDLKWVDPATQVAGEGRLIGLGDHGELLVRVSENGTSRTHSLFGEEITAVAVR